jgi:hypothetical protein
MARILLTKPCDVQLLATCCCCLARGSAISAPSSIDTASPSSDFLLSFPFFRSLLIAPIPTQSTTTTPASLAMAHDQPSQADGEPQDAPGPPIALDDFASSEIPDLESSWVDSGDGNAHQLTALSEENQLQDIAQPPVAHHHCAACTDPACEGAGSTAAEVGSHDTSVGLDFHTVRNKTPTELVLQEHASAATLRDVPSSEPIGPNLFQRLSPEIRDTIFELVYADSNIVVATQGAFPCAPKESASDRKRQREPCAEVRTRRPVLLKGTRGRRARDGCYIDPFSHPPESYSGSFASDESEDEW